MESIIVLAIIYFVFKSFAKKGGNFWNTVKAKIDEVTEAQTSPPVRQNATKTRSAQRKPAAAQPEQRPTTEGSAAYVPIQPTIRANNEQFGSQGSMNVMSPEGTRSLEGMDTGNVLPNQMRASSLAAYALDEPQTAGAPILPALWNVNTMAQAVVLSIVLEKPNIMR